jgi:hypothetical protein
MKKLGWRGWLVLALFLVAVFVTSFFLVRTVRRAIYWHNHRDEPIRAWMSVPYVAHSYSVPLHVLNRAIGLPELKRDRRPLREIAREQDRPVETLIHELEEAIIHARPPYPPPPPPARMEEGGAP